MSNWVTSGQEPSQRLVDEDDLVLGVVDDVDELLRGQPEVEGMQHPAGAGRGEVEFQVAGGVPREGGDPALGADAQCVEHAAEPAGPLGPRAT